MRTSEAMKVDRTVAMGKHQILQKNRVSWKQGKEGMWRCHPWSKSASVQIALCALPSRDVIYFLLNSYINYLCTILMFSVVQSKIKIVEWWLLVHRQWFCCSFPEPHWAEETKTMDAGNWLSPWRTP